MLQALREVVLEQRHIERTDEHVVADVFNLSRAEVRRIVCAAKYRELWTEYRATTRYRLVPGVYDPNVLNERAGIPESAEIGHTFRTEFGFQGWAYVGLIGLQVLWWGLPHAETWSWWQAALGTLSGLVCAVAVWALIDTGYRVAGGCLHLRMGPLRKRIALQSITGVRTEGPKLGTHFGLGWDLIQIDYVGGSVAVSPRDPAAFLAAIGHRPE